MLLQLKYMLESAIKRRHPTGTKVHIIALPDFDMAKLTAAWSKHGLCITRAKVRSFTGTCSCHCYTNLCLEHAVHGTKTESYNKLLRKPSSF